MNWSVSKSMSSLPTLPWPLRQRRTRPKPFPFVFTAANDPLGDGQVASLARPGGNLTGFSLLAPELNAKRLELLKEVAPTATRIAFLTRLGTATAEQRFKEAEADARALGLRLQFVGAK